MPEEGHLSAAEKSIQTEKSLTEIVHITEQPNSLVLNYFLWTELLTLISVIGDRLVLAKGDMAKALQECHTIRDTFCINLNDHYEIVEYSRIPIQ